MALGDLRLVAMRADSASGAMVSAGAALARRSIQDIMRIRFTLLNRRWRYRARRLAFSGSAPPESEAGAGRIGSCQLIALDPMLRHFTARYVFVLDQNEIG
jgi:hypothetical protein